MRLPSLPMSSASPAVITVIGHDQKGVVARVSTYLAEQQINIEHIDQKVMEGLFIMTMLVDLSDISIGLDALVLELKALGEELKMETRVRLHGEKTRRKIAVLVSKEAHCLERLARDHREGNLDADIAVVLSNHQDLAPLAEKYSLPFRYFPSTDKKAHTEFLLRELAEVKPDFVVLARYMQVLTSEVVDAFTFKVVNIHPSLLPYYPGANAYKQAYDAGIRVCGCTAHFVTEDLDQGPIILQDVFHIHVGDDTLDDIKKQGRKLEAEVLARAVQLVASEQVVVADGKVLFRPGRLERPA